MFQVEGFFGAARTSRVRGMVRIGFSTHVKLAARQVSSLGHRTSARMVAQALAHLKRRDAPFQHLVIVPPDLRAADPSFWREVQGGHFGLAGAVAELNGRTPFEVNAPSAAWAEQLHTFAWLRHLEASSEPAAEAVARSLIEHWQRNPSCRDGVATGPAVCARRILSWLSHAPFVLDGAPEAFFDLFGQALAADVKTLSLRGLKDTEGLPRLLAATALVVAHLALEGHERFLPRALDHLDHEIERQILADGGHLSRNPQAIFELLLDWLPLKSCIEGRGHEPRTTFLQALHRLLALLRYLRLGDGGLARFNGMGTGDPVAVATLLAYDDEPPPGSTLSNPSGYARLSCGPTILIADIGPPPPLVYSTTAHAGCLSIEVSSGGALLLANPGAPDPTQPRWRAVARSTASHSTVSVSESSSSVLVRHPRLEAAAGTPPLRGPDRVTSALAETAQGVILTASHDGYVGRYNLEHHRELTLASDGAMLSGRDRLQTPGAQDRLKRDIPFAIHFHLHPDTTCTSDADAVLVTLRDGQIWRFEAPGHKIAVEESLSFAASSGPRGALQIVVRGSTGGLTEVAWNFMHVSGPRPSARPR